MENKNVDAVASGGTPVSSRWNPTKEQISMLENLYMQGIRTPSAEQIQQITTGLRAFGQIEGKNVFYWFQNHKARQRQKQKQENMASANRFHNKSIPTTTPHPCTNVVCSPYYMSHGGVVGFYQPTQYPKVLLPGGAKRRPAMDKVEKTKVEAGGDGNEGIMINSDNITCDHETLTLFPLHPTGILESGRSSDSFRTTSSMAEATINTTVAEEGCAEQPLIDFFGEEASCEDE
ncbi:hypothetical protein NE237_005308 [Protea cynaroides]|uniref:Homeobox domain-containing protein n=1 Tax=Protea cynaroides TaxID=273540 RepID=A0A9Q0QUI1_9MAGN|nr:hypothetical protein NE237_005308 [Protea cynaroides]